MPRKPRKPGFWFWIWTFTLGAFSPGEGKHRVNSKMTELHNGIKNRDDQLKKCREQLGVRDSEIKFLRMELKEQVAKNNQLLTALHMNEGMKTVVNMRTPGWSRESADEEVDTISIPVVSTN